jgi:hypothetical protein
MGEHLAKWQKHEQYPVEYWKNWLDLEPDINIGFLTGRPSGLVGIDIDTEEGRVLLEQNESFIGWDKTWQYRTGKGLRVLFSCAPRADGNGAASAHDPIRSGVFTRGDSHLEILGCGRQTVLPPSLHPGGEVYRWVPGYTPRDIPTPVVWADRDPLGSPTDGLAGLNSDAEDWEETLSERAPAGRRNDTLTRVVGHLMAPAPVPAGEALRWAMLWNKSMCKPPLPDGEVAAIVTSITRREKASASTLAKKLGVSKDHAQAILDSQED